MGTEEEDRRAAGGGAGPAPWAGLTGDLLAEIFARVPFQDRVRAVPAVCREWREAALEPACWRVVDMTDWFKVRVEGDYWWEFECEPAVDALVRRVVELSRGQLRELRTTHCSDAAILDVADSSRGLTVLGIPGSLLVTDRSATQLASRCPGLQELDVSDCYNISNQALEAFGRSCPALAWLGRNMLKKLPEETASGAEPGGDEEAIVVSKHMGGLKHLEMKKTSLSDAGLEHLARGCGQLETLNLACCSALSPMALKNVSRQCANLKDFTRPITPRMHVVFHGFPLF